MFQSGEREIFESAAMLREHYGTRLEVLPLYARLRASDQARIFKPGGKRRVVLATNVAETSLTVPNIGFVIDPGYARVNRYSYRSKLERLPVEPVSQASANQRAGRCGRVAPGVCFRLYTEADFAGRQEFSDPEILRVNLASVVLQMRAFGLGDIRRFGFIEPPDPRAVKDAHRLLNELGALRDDKITKTGRAMARLPVDPRLARMLVAAASSNALRELLVIVSGLTVQDPRDRPYDKRAAADAKHEQFLDERGDFFTLLNVWHWLNNLKASASRSGERKALTQNFLNPARVREWRALHRQLSQNAKQLGWRLSQQPATTEEVHRSVLAGSLSLIGVHDERGVFLGARGSKFRIFPGSSMTGQTPKWVAAAEVSETARVYARTVCEVRPRWIESLAGHLLSRNWNEPHWSANRGEACAYERVSLYGLVLADRRKVPLAKRDAATARDLLVRDGLLPAAMPKKVLQQVAFIEANAAVIAQIRDLESKGRRRDLLAADDELAARLDRQLPAVVVDGTSLLRWWRQADDGERSALFFDRASLLQGDPTGLGEDLYPAELEVAGQRLELSYRFAPGAPDDGVNLRVPSGLLQALTPELLEWSVPGYLPMIVEGWLRGLPKAQRRKLSPLADKIDPVTRFISHPRRLRQGRLASALSDAVRGLFDVQVVEADWQPDRLDDVLRVRVELIEGKNKVIDADRSIAELQARHQVAAAAAVDLAQPVETGLKAFPEQLPESLTLSSGSLPVLVFPALVDQGDSVSLFHFELASEAADANRQGLSRLALLHMGGRTRYFRREIDRQTKLGLHYASLGDADQLRDELMRFVAWCCYFEGQDPVRSRAEFERRMEAGRGDFAERFESALAGLSRTLEERFELMKVLQAASSKAFAAARQDIERVALQLCPADVLATAELAWLTELPRYLSAQRYRLDNLQGKVARDADTTQQMVALEQRLQRVGAHRLCPTSKWRELRFQLEEVRVNRYAEPLSLKGRGSAKKLASALSELERDLGLL